MPLLPAPAALVRTILGGCRNMTTQLERSVPGTPGYTEGLLARARRVIPGGASAAGRRVCEEVIVRTEGAYLWNADGTRYIDYLLDYGPIVVGHSDPRVNEAVARTAATN